MRRTWLLTLMIVVLAVVAAACGDAAEDDAPVEGVVTQVSGSLGNVESFVVMDEDGESHMFDPEPGLLFYGAPLDHLRDHIVTGQKVKITYERGAYGALTATLIEHADGDSQHEMPSGEEHDMSEMSEGEMSEHGEGEHGGHSEGEMSEDMSDDM